MVAGYMAICQPPSGPRSLNAGRLPAGRQALGQAARGRHRRRRPGGAPARRAASTAGFRLEPPDVRGVEARPACCSWRVGGALSNWAVASNRFFSAIIRIQRDRGHHVVDAGPYRLVRHPAYLASMVLHARGRSRPGLVVGASPSWRRSASSSSCGRRWRTGRCAPNSTGMRSTPVASATGCCRGCW